MCQNMFLETIGILSDILSWMFEWHIYDARPHGHKTLQYAFGLCTPTFFNQNKVLIGENDWKLMKEKLCT